MGAEYSARRLLSSLPGLVVFGSFYPQFETAGYSRLVAPRLQMSFPKPPPVVRPQTRVRFRNFNNSPIFPGDMAIAMPVCRNPALVRLGERVEIQGKSSLGRVRKSAHGRAGNRVLAANGLNPRSISTGIRAGFCAQFFLFAAVVASGRCRKILPFGAAAAQFLSEDDFRRASYTSP